MGPISRWVFPPGLYVFIDRSGLPNLNLEFSIAWHTGTRSIRNGKFLWCCSSRLWATQWRMQWPTEPQSSHARKVDSGKVHCSFSMIYRMIWRMVSSTPPLWEHAPRHVNGNQPWGSFPRCSIYPCAPGWCHTLRLLMPVDVPASGKKPFFSWRSCNRCRMIFRIWWPTQLWRLQLVHALQPVFFLEFSWEDISPRGELTFSRMRSKGSRFTLGVWGLSCVRQSLSNCSQPFATVRNCPQPFANVRNRPQPSAWGPYGRAYGKFCKRCHFSSFPASRSFVSRSRRGTLWHSNMFHDVSNWFCLAVAILLQRFQKMICIFSRQAQHFGDLPCHFAWQAQHFRRVVLRVFANFIVSAARSGDKWHYVTHDENRRKPRTKRRFWGRFVRKLVGKRRFWRCNVWNVRKSRTKCSFWCPSMSRLESLASVVPSQCLWGKLQNLVECFKAGCNVLRGKRGISWHFHVSANASKSFCVAGAILFRRFQKMICSFRGRRSTLETSDVILRGTRSTLDVSCSLFLANGNVRAASSGDIQHSAIHTPHSTPYTDTLHFTLHTLHFTLYTPHFTLYTPHFTLYTLHPTLYPPTPHSTLYTLHSTLYTPHFTLHTLHFTFHAPHFTLYTPHFTLHILHFALYTPHSAFYTPHSTFHTVHFTLCTLHSTLHILHSTLNIPHCTFYTLHFTLHTPHFTLHTQHSTLYTLHLALYTFYIPHPTFCTPHSTLHTFHFPLHSLHSKLYT